jgi:folate/biopterin transporter
MASFKRLNNTYGASFVLLMGLCFFTQAMRCFPWMAMAYWYKDNLKVDPGTMQFLLSTASLPMVAKPVYGIISDSVYIKGAHRVPYLIVAGGLQLFAWSSIALVTKVSSTATMLTAFLTITNFGGAISEVVQDAMLTEAGKNKVGAQHGELQSFAWLCMATGGVVGNLTAGYAMKLLSPTAMIQIFMFLLSLQLLLSFAVSEQAMGLGPVKKDSDDEPKLKEGRKGLAFAIRDQISQLKYSLQKPALYKPLLWFLSSYAVIPGIGGAIFFFQTEHLGLEASALGVARLVGQSGLLLGSMLYNKALKGVPLRRILAIVQILLSLCMMTDIVIVKRINLHMGIPDKVFVLGASAFVEAIGQFKFLPFTVMLAQLCPPGCEASVFAFFASAQTIAGLTNGYLGVALANYLKISASDFSRLPTGIFIQSLCAMLPVLWIGLIPAEPKQIKEVQMGTMEEETKKEL